MTTQTAIKERPILFSGEMVRAILAGTKTQTRRALTTQPLDVLPMSTPGQWIALTEREPEPRGTMFRCRYGVPGNRLWVRETWCECDGDAGRAVAYKADDWTDCPAGDGHWRPSIFLPRYASRITLEITGVRVERVQDISEADAEAEGVAGIKTYAAYSMRDKFWALWNEINAKRGYGWDTNPWVWVIEFQRVQP